MLKKIQGEEGATEMTSGKVHCIKVLKEKAGQRVGTLKVYEGK